MIRRIFALTIFTSLVVQVASDCNCKVGCARNPHGRCRSCKEGWDGPFCQRKNVALNGTATQIGTYYNRLNKSYSAELAVDGNADTNYTHGSCTRTKWWSVQLGDNGVNQIRYMKIYKEVAFFPMNVIEIDGKRCRKWSGLDEIPGTIEDVTCSETLAGHNLTITGLQLGLYKRSFSLCEVQVFVCSDGWFGEDCDKRCKCLNSDEVCEKVTGRCKRGCRAGYEGDDCQTLCRDGRYEQGCSEECGHCVHNQACNKSTGHCPGACEDGWSGQKCEACRDGRYGQDCSEECGHCVDNLTCDKTDGHCPGACEDGWGGMKCDVCRDGRYGQDCSKECGHCVDNLACDKTDGHCPSCSDGWSGKKCDACRDGRYGQDCSKYCGHCVHNQVCNNSSGHCPGACVDGWGGAKCEACRKGKYGQDCYERCGHCADNQACDKIDGHCPGACEDGWDGKKCEKTKCPVQPTIVAAVVTGLLVLLSYTGIFLCLLRHQKLQWVKKSTKKPDQEMSNVEQQPTDSSAHAHSSGHVESNYAALDTSLMTSEPEDKTYEALKNNTYQNT